jgi:hypothetical protein
MHAELLKREWSQIDLVVFIPTYSNLCPQIVLLSSEFEGLVWFVSNLDSGLHLERYNLGC